MHHVRFLYVSPSLPAPCLPSTCFCSPFFAVKFITFRHFALLFLFECLPITFAPSAEMRVFPALSFTTFTNVTRSVVSSGNETRMPLSDMDVERPECLTFVSRALFLFITPLSHGLSRERPSNQWKYKKKHVKCTSLASWFSTCTRSETAGVARPGKERYSLPSHSFIFAASFLNCKIVLILYVSILMHCNKFLLLILHSRSRGGMGDVLQEPFNGGRPII